MDLLDEVKERLLEFTSTILIDYERQSLLLEVQKNYIDEVIRYLMNNVLDLEIVFQKELKKDIITLVACITPVVEFLDE